MATSRSKSPASKETDTQTEKEKLEKAAAGLDPPDEGLKWPAVVVFREPTGDGNEQVKLAPINGLDPLAVPTLLEWAIKVHRQTIGLDKGK